jgi:non-ribosomal peptide synthetase component F
MKVLAMAGEKLTQSDVDRWKGQRHILNWYGPAECSSATFCAVDTDNWHSGVIGQIDSQHPTLCWLVDPRNHNKLVPFGAIGEVALEGPGCSDGYIGNSTLTDRVFRKNPKFLTVGHGSETPIAI